MNEFIVFNICPLCHVEGSGGNVAARMALGKWQAIYIYMHLVGFVSSAFRCVVVVCAFLLKASFTSFSPDTRLLPLSTYIWTYFLWNKRPSLPSTKSHFAQNIYLTSFSYSPFAV